jgi:hypothetical protein
MHLDKPNNAVLLIELFLMFSSFTQDLKKAPEGAFFD